MAASSTSDRPPPRLQFRLGTLLLAMVVLGIACAALAMPTPFWTGTLLCLALLSLLSSILLAIYRTGVSRAFAVGFLVFAGGYLACVLLFDRSLRKLDYQAPMPTTRLASTAFYATHGNNRRSVTVQVGSFGSPAGTAITTSTVTGSTVTGVTTRTMQIPVHNAEDFVEITHSVLSLLLGLLGGIFARFLFATRREENSAATNIAQGYGGAGRDTT